MTEATAKQGALLEDSTFNVITQIEKKANFLFSWFKNTCATQIRTTNPS